MTTGRQFPLVTVLEVTQSRPNRFDIEAVPQIGALTYHQRCRSEDVRLFYWTSPSQPGDGSGRGTAQGAQSVTPATAPPSPPVLATTALRPLHWRGHHRGRGGQGRTLPGVAYRSLGAVQKLQRRFWGHGILADRLRQTVRQDAGYQRFHSLTLGKFRHWF